MVYSVDTRGGCEPASANPTLNNMRLHYAPLQQLALDLQNNTVADYNWITPNQYNDQHSNLGTGYGGHASNDDRSEVAQGDNFLARVVPLIMASKAYKDHGLIVLWWDESEGGDDPSRTLPFIIISKEAHKNVDGVPYSNTIQYSHSSFLRTMQVIFDVDPRHRFTWLGGAATATDLSDLFKEGVIK